MQWYTEDLLSAFICALSCSVYTQMRAVQHCLMHTSQDMESSCTSAIRAGLPLPASKASRAAFVGSCTPSDAIRGATCEQWWETCHRT